MVIADAIIYLQKVVKENLTLKNYDRRKDLAQEYYDYYTGLLDDRLQKIVSRESEEEFTQRKKLTNHITKSILNSVKLPFQKAARKQPIVRKIEFKDNSDQKKQDIENFLNIYNGDKSLDQFMELMLLEYNLIDPNAFLIIEFQPNTESEKAKPYPFIAPSDKVIDYNYINGIIEYVIVRLPIKYIEDKLEKDGKKFTMYNGNETIVLEQVGSDYIKAGNEEIIELKDNFYKQIIFKVRAELDPLNIQPAAIQFGYILDPETQYETYLSIFDCALPYLRKTLKVNSELDQSMSMSAFPQRFRYVYPCPNPACNKGMLLDNTACPSCGGTGHAKVHKGAQDVQTLDIPKTKEEMFDLSQMAYDHFPPIDILQFDKDFIKDLKISVHTTIFNADIFSKPEVTNTATEKLIDVDNMNDTLYAFCRRYSQIWQFNVYFIAVFTDNVKQDQITIQHKFPGDLKLKSLTELMADLKAAYDSNASNATISAIEDDINEILYSDRPSELKKIRVQQQFHPFRGFSPLDIQFLLTTDQVTKFNRCLYVNYSSIWADLERENPTIYDFDEKRLWAMIQEKVKVLQDALTSEQPKQVMKVNFNQPLNTVANG